MAKEINGELFFVRFQNGTSCFVECVNINDLYHYVARKSISYTPIVQSVVHMRNDGCIENIPLGTHRFKQILTQYKNIAYAKKRLAEHGYTFEDTPLPNCVRVYYKETEGYTLLVPGDEMKEGFVTIDGQSQNIDEWLNQIRQK